MTREQIAELHAWVYQRAYQPLSGEGLRGSVRRVLDEREALLEALRNIAEEAEGGSWVAATAQAAIAKAEAE
jgi:hypothetical protein